MHCGLAEPKLLRYLHGELQETEARALRIHLASCRACSAELEQLRLEGARFQAMALAAVPEGLELRTLARLRSFAASTRTGAAWAQASGYRFWRALVVSAASVALAAAGLALISPPAYAMVVSSVLRLGAQVNAAASVRFPAWGEFVRILAGIRMLVGI